MLVFKGEGLGSMYYQLIRHVTENGRKVTVRGNNVIELKEPVTLVYEKPGYCWMNIPNRRFNPFFALAEVYWILSGRGDIDWIAYYNKKMRDFNDGGPENHGAYGLRIRQWETDAIAGETSPVDQIQHVVRKLKADPFSRQAVITLWDPIRDNLVVSKDYPCNNLVYYSLRNGILDQTVVMRSNDLVWGTPVNAIQFTHLHALVAGNLGAKMGTFTYVIQNLHYYFDLYKDVLANLLEKAFEDRDIYGGSYPTPGALCVPNFDVLDEKDLIVLGQNISYIQENWHKEGTWSPIRQAHFSGDGYWNQTIPQVLWIHRILKESTEISQADIEYLAVRILTLGAPLTELILDFLSGSKIPLNQEVVKICKELLQPTNG